MFYCVANMPGGPHTCALTNVTRPCVIDLAIDQRNQERLKPGYFLVAAGQDANGDDGMREIGPGREAVRRARGGSVGCSRRLCGADNHGLDLGRDCVRSRSSMRTRTLSPPNPAATTATPAVPSLTNDEGMLVSTIAATKSPAPTATAPHMAEYAHMANTARHTI
jgi:hypothetical protein